MIVVAYKSEGTITGSTVSDTLGTSYTLAKQISGEPNNLKVWVGTPPVGGICTVTIGSPAGSFDRLGVMEIAGVTATVDATASSYNSTTPFSLAVTTTVANDFIFAAVAGYHNSSTFTFTGNFTLTSQSNGSDANAIGYCAAGAAGTYTLTVSTTGGSDNQPAILVALKAATPPSGSNGDIFFLTSSSPYKGFVYNSGWNAFS